MFAQFVEELTGDTISQLDHRLAAAKRKRDEADMEIAAITALVDQHQLFQLHGHRGVTGYLKQQLNCPPSEATRIRRRSRLLNQHPEIGDRLGTSRIGAAQVDLLADAHRHRVAGQRFAEFAKLLTGQAETLEFAEFKIAVQHFVTQADPDGAFDEQQFSEDHRTASVAIVDGAVNVHAFGGDPLAAAEIKAAFDRAVDAEFHNDCETRRREHGEHAHMFELPRTSQQRHFDAMHEIFLRSTTAPADGKRPEPLVDIVVDATTALAALARHGLIEIEGDDSEPVDPTSRRCHTSTGTPVHPDVAVTAMIRGSIRRVIVDANDVVINLGRSQRLFTGHTRTAAKLLATRCGHRGCDVPAEFCDIDHIDEWIRDRGGTDQHNALPLCGVHDRWKHQQRLRGRRDRHGRIHLIRPDGTTIKALNAREPEWVGPPPPQTITWDEWTKRPPPAGTDRNNLTVTIYDLVATGRPMPADNS